MIESKTINLPKSMPLKERIAEVNKRISEWLNSLENPFSVETDELQLTKYERSNEGYSYHYSIIYREKVSASDENIQMSLLPTLKPSWIPALYSQTRKPRIDPST